VEKWRKDIQLYHIAGPEIDRFFLFLAGTEQREEGSLAENAAHALHRIREEMSSPKELCRCHFQLLNALYSGEWGKPVGDALAHIVATQWGNVSVNQRFALTSPALYAPILKAKCEDRSRSGFSQVASILKTAAAAAGVSFAQSAAEFLTNIENRL
jgi:hypothetical protein